MLFLFLSYMMLYVSTLLHPCRINAAVWLPHLSTMLEVCKFVSRYSSCVPVEVHTHSLRMLPPSYLATPQERCSLSAAPQRVSLSTATRK